MAEWEKNKSVENVIIGYASKEGEEVRFAVPRWTSQESTSSCAPDESFPDHLWEVINKKSAFI